MQTILGFLLLMLGFGHGFPAWIQPASGMGLLHGGVFLDQDADGVWDDDEKGVSEAEIQCLHSAGATMVISAPDGRFMLSADPGMWRVDLVVPQGYVARNDPTRMVWIGDEGVWEAEFLFALQLNEQKQGDLDSHESAFVDLQDAVFGEMEATPSGSELAAEKETKQASDRWGVGGGALLLISLLMFWMARLRRGPSSS